MLLLNEQNFESEVLNYDGTVLIDLYADWCGPCKRMAPLIESLSEENLPNVKICKVNIDESPDIAVKYNVMSIPTFLIIKNGEVVNSFIGVTDIEKIREALV